MTTHELFRLIEENRHRRVAVAAYHLWEAAGRPHGRDVDFWLAAERRCRRDHDAEQQALRRRLLCRLAACRSTAEALGLYRGTANNPAERAALRDVVTTFVNAGTLLGAPPEPATSATPTRPATAAPPAATPEPTTAAPPGWSRGWDWGFRWLLSRLGRRGR